MIKLTSITKSFEKKVVLNEIDAVFSSNALSVITGESGCGKTTLFNILNGYLQSDSGHIDISTHRILYNMVDDMNINILTVLDNLKLVTNNTERIEEILEVLEIDSLKKKKVSKLSKGEQIRVSIARALLSDFDTILLDEPTGNLDEQTAKTVFEVLKKESNDKTILVVTHDKELAMDYADFLYELKDGKLNLISEKKNSKFDQALVDVKSDSKILYKYAYKKAVHKPILYALAVLLMIITTFSVFTFAAYGQIDKKDTSKSIINALQEDYFTVVKDDSFTKYDTELAYKQGKEISTQFMLYTNNYRFRKNDFIPATFYEEFKEFYAFPKPINEYNIPPQESDSTIKYYPIIINNHIRKFFLDEYQLNYKIGDVFDYTFQSAAMHGISFVIVDILEVDGNYDSVYNMFPVVISKNAYEDMIQSFGIFDTTIVSGLCEIHNNEMLGFISDQSNLISKSYVENIMPLEDIKENGFFYVGRFPQDDNEIMLSDFSLYYKLTGDLFLDAYAPTDDYRERQEVFLSKYKDGYPLSILETFNNSKTSIETNIKVVGCFGYMEDNKPFSNLGFTMLSDGLFSKLENDILNQERMIYNYQNSYYISKEEVLNQYSNILNETIKISEKSVSLVYWNLLHMQGFVNIILYIGLAIFVLSLIVILIYLNNNYKEMKHDFAVFQVYGKTKKDLIKVLMMFLAITILPAVVAIPISIPFVELISQAQFNSYNLTGAKMSFSYGIPFLCVICTLVSYILISLFPLLRFKKKNFLGVIKNE